MTRVLRRRRKFAYLLRVLRNSVRHDCAAGARHAPPIAVDELDFVADPRRPKANCASSGPAVVLVSYVEDERTAIVHRRLLG